MTTTASHALGTISLGVIFLGIASLDEDGLECDPSKYSGEGER